MNGPGLVRPGPLSFRANARYDNLTSRMASPAGDNAFSGVTWPDPAANR
jgi:hypothetical protein